MTGRAYGHRATLEIAGDALTWRARRNKAFASTDTVAENIATTAHDIDGVRWVERRFSPGGAAHALLSVIWMISESLSFGIGTFALAAAMIAYRIARPRRWLALDVRGRWLILRVDGSSAPHARTLTSRIEQRLLTGETQDRPLALP
ncbi:MAG: hypothetical protein NT062_35870 [Proteobacteria bacterium]|nr:hypothetical protein [Pseudomonadota bacterium]